MINDKDREVIDVTEMPEDERAEIAMKFIDGDGGINDMLKLKSDTFLDRISDVPKTITTEQYGDTEAAALGRAYKVRDRIEKYTDLNASCELTGKEWILPSTRFYEIEITIEE